jgi:ectoine hydroxylase-related dioxygenase (phytanoyl-CoA dioxygenase family)
VLGSALEDASRRADLHAEWANVLNVGAGVLVLKQAYADTAPVDEATEVFELVIREEREAGGAVADHFAKLGANDRIWNAQQKLCLRAPSVFARYFANSAPCAMPEAWLGPHFQVTSQVNVVRPRGDGLKNRTGRNGAQLISMVQGCKRLRVRLSPVPNGSRTLPGQRSESPFVRNSGRLSRAPSALWRTSVAPCAAD